MSMVNVSKIVKGLTNIGSDAFSHVHVKAPQTNPESGEKLSGGISKEASDVVSGYGKALITSKTKLLGSHKDYEDEMRILAKKFPRTSANGTIPIDEAVKEFDMLDLSENQKADLLLACAFQTKSNETVLSRPALYMAKYVILDCYGKVPNKLDKAIRTAIYDEGKVFDVDFFYDLFKPRTWVPKRSAEFKKSPTGSDKLAHFNMARKGAIYDALRENSTKRSKISIKTTDIFTPLDKVSENIASKLDALIESGVEIPQELVKTMKSELTKYNFDLKKVFADYYSLLKECQTLEDVKKIYPELRFPTELRKKDFNINTTIDLSLRMKQGGIDKPVIEALQKLYTEFTPASKTFIHIDGSTSTNVVNLRRAGYVLSEPDEKVLGFLKECEDTQLKYKKISQMSQDKLEPLIEKHALRTSGVWKDFIEITKSGKWMPIRLIKNKRMYPETTKYSTEKLVDTYLFNLFLRNPYQRYSPNPLCRFDGINYLDDTAKNILNRTYMIRFLTKEEGIPANITWTEFVKKYSKDFEEFKRQFDIAAIGKSFEHIEDTYHRHFYRSYWTNARFETLQKQMEKSRDIAYEKVIWGEEFRQKEIDVNQVKNLVKADEGICAEPAAKLIDPKEFSNYKYRVLTIRDPKLREKFQSAIAQGRETNADYFKVYNDILSEAFDGKHVDETKAHALINIHEKYLSEAVEGTQSITEAEFKAQILAKYKTSSGINYEKIVKDTNAGADYVRLSAELIDENSTEFLTELERRFKDDYAGINEIIEKYLQTPQIFREKFRNIYTKSTPSCPNIVLHRELSTFLEKIEGWHFERDELINLDKEKLGQFDDNFSQYVVLPLELKEKIWKLSAQNYETCDELLTKFYNNAKKRTGESGGTGLKTLTQTGKNKKSLPPELKILGKHGGWRLYSRKATPEDIEKYGKVKYVFYDVVKTH